MTTTTTSGAVIQRYKIGYHSDEWGVRSSTPSGIYDDAGPWVRYADHVTALAAGQATAAQQPGAAYAALPEPITYQIAVLKACEHGDALVGWRVEPSRQSFDASMRPKRKLYTEGDMHDFADRTHALRASRGQTLRLLTQKEMDSLGRRAEGMDGNEWDQWVQEKFAQVNGLRVQGGSYE